jgi:hypothetical protein
VRRAIWGKAEIRPTEKNALSGRFLLQGAQYLASILIHSGRIGCWVRVLCLVVTRTNLSSFDDALFSPKLGRGCIAISLSLGQFF